jgi:hypothetical protein
VIVKYYEDSHNTEGVFYLGYFEDDLQGQAIRREYNFVKGACISCNHYNFEAFNKWSKYVTIRPFSVPASALTGTNLFSGQSIQYDLASNFGINVSLTVYCDMTEFFILNKALFADAYAMKTASLLLKEIAYSTRMTAISDKNRAIAMADLDQSSPSAWIQEYLTELKALAIDFSGLSSKCLPEPASKGITVGAI